MPSKNNFGNELRYRKWTKETCLEEAKKYSDITSWKKNSGGSYQAASRNNWQECFSHITLKPRESMVYWTLERCKEEALKYKTRSEWAKNSTGSYSRAALEGWIGQCAMNMKAPNQKKII